MRIKNHGRTLKMIPGVVLGRITTTSAGGTEGQTDRMEALHSAASLRIWDSKPNQAAAKEVRRQSLMAMQTLKMPEGRASNLPPEPKTPAQAMKEAGTKDGKQCLQLKWRG